VKKKFSQKYVLMHAELYTLPDYTPGPAPLHAETRVIQMAIVIAEESCASNLTEAVILDLFHVNNLWLQSQLEKLN